MSKRRREPAPQQKATRANRIARGTEAIEALIASLTPAYTVVIVTHNMAQARRASDQCVFMLLGKLVEQGSTVDMFLRPTERETELYVEGRYG